MAETNFDRLTAIQARPGGGHLAQIVPEMTIDGSRPNGGYLLALLGRAAVAAVEEVGSDHLHPVAAAAQYLTAPALGPAELETEVLRSGRTASQVQARLIQDGAVRVQCLFVIGLLRAGAAPYWTRESPFHMDEPVRLESDPERPPSMHLTMDHGYDPRSLGGPETAPDLPAELRVEWSLRDGSAPDVFSLLLAADGLPPAAFGLGLAGWIPTLQLTVYIRALPSPGPLRIRVLSRLVQDGLLDELCEVWDSSGRLVAQASQLAAARIPTGPEGALQAPAPAVE
ncbi:MAG TPA: thioesterase family protein [Acidimicrobiales bacterium]|nr:thioesterase family protein [Acidimicrobiales bacterium]